MLLPLLAIAFTLGGSDAAASAAGVFHAGDPRPAVELSGGATPARVLALATVRNPALIVPDALVSAVLELDGKSLSKTLHAGDPDILWPLELKPGAKVKLSLVCDAKQERPLEYALKLITDGPPPAGSVDLEREPNDMPSEANEIKLETTVYGLADDRPYLPKGTSYSEAEREAGKDWFTFEYQGASPKLCFLSIDFVDRDVPPDLRVYREIDGKMVEYAEGIDPQSLQRERPPRPGANKFTTRVLARGRYFVMVDACQPEYQLRTKLFDLPPYLKAESAAEASDEAVATAARSAIRTAMDFQLLAGDSWHANTPRKGHPLDRVSNPHHETATCIACHPTHFATQSALAAVKAGERVEQPFALLFLTDRLANNPVPFYGKPEALWARVIPAPANVMSRLSTILMDYENLVSKTPRNNLHKGVGEFLKLYYDGRTELPPDESNGNNPVSRFKVAADSWRQLDELFRRTGDPRWSETRDLIAKLTPPAAPANTRDLAQKVVALAWMGAEGSAKELGSALAKLRELQHPDGHWPIKFDAGSPGAEMQTGECLFAMAQAGVGRDDPAVQKGLRALLVRQKPFGGWLDLGPYEQFQTPFRETQWALTALSAYHPLKRQPAGWSAPLGPEPESLSSESGLELVTRVERLWDPPAPPTLTALAKLLTHENPIVRYSAARALSRVGDVRAIDPLCKALGDDSKVVRRAVAEAVRSIGNRIEAQGAPGDNAEKRALTSAIVAALQSDDDLVRRGATRIFAAHFRDLSQELALADALIGRIDDRDPVTAMQAIKGLWRFWYWRADQGVREKIEDALIQRLAVESRPWPRTNLIEALYIIGDDNIRYLFNNWIPSLAKEEDRRRASEAEHAGVNRLGEKYLRALASGNAMQKEGILRSMAEFPERPVLGGRVGNDLEPMVFHGETRSRMASALARLAADGSPEIRKLALEAMVTVRGLSDGGLSRSVFARRGDANRQVRDWAGLMAKEFPLKLQRGQSDAGLDGMIDDMLVGEAADAQAAALEVIGRIAPLKDDQANAKRRVAVRDRLRSQFPQVRAAALAIVPAFAELTSEKAVVAAIEDAVTDPDPGARIAAVKLALDHAGLVPDRELRKALEDPTPGHRLALLDLLIKSPNYAKDLRMIGVVSSALLEEDAGVSERALRAVQSSPGLTENPAVAASLREITESENARRKELAKSLLASRGRKSSSAAKVDALDLVYFERKVLPIFAKAGEDGQSCVGCHRSHSILKLIPPDASGRFSPESVRLNYRSALRVVNPADPAASLILGKPTWEAAEEAEAQRDASKHAHAGGIRFEAKTSAEYQTILDWINGAAIKREGHERSPASR